MPLRVLIVDDEAPARQRLADLLGELDAPLGSVETAEDGVDALDKMEAAEAPYDLVFLDVRMPELDGFDVLDRLDPAHRPAVVFTTAYDEYAVRAFEANAVDYLLKPVAPDRLADAVRRAETRTAPSADARVDRLAALLDALDEPAAQEPAPAREAPLRQFTIQGVDRLMVVHVDALVSAEVSDGITNLYTLSPDGDGLQRHIVSFTLDALDARLDPERFLRVHRGAIIAVDHVRALVPWFSGRYKVELTGGHEVTASRSRSRELRERLSL